jgi:hypothetical protein
MKNLKKLSAAFMLAALFSFSLTSCIDDSVDPVVEAIYANQANLIAAQAAVQNAEAVLLASEAEYNLALAAYELSRAAENNADAAYRLEEVEKLKIANAEAQVVLEKNQAQLAIDLAELLNELNEVNALAALDYALSYRTYMFAANDLLKNTYDAQVLLAEAQYEVDFGTVSTYAQLAFENAVAVAELQVQWQLERIAALEAILADPSSLPAQVTAWEEQYEALDVLKGEFKDQEVILQAQIDELIQGTDDDRDKFIEEYEEYLGDITGLEGDIKTQQDIIDDALLAIADYAAALTAAELAVTNAETAYDDKWAALGDDEDAAANAIAFGATEYYQVDADEVAIAVGGDKYAAPANFQEVLVNARIDTFDLALVLSDLESDFEDLVEAYNDAAADLAAAQDDTAEAAALAAAIIVTGNAETAFTLAETAYETAKSDFEADPDGFDEADGPDLAVDDLGEIGIPGGDAKTYMRVKTFVETSNGSNEYVPATFYAGQIDGADLAAAMAAIVADNGDAENTDVDALDEITVWEQNGDAVDGDGVAADGSSGNGDSSISTGETFLTSADVVDADLFQTTYFLEVETGDTSIAKQFTFNIATNMLGLNDFSDRAYTEAALVAGDADAGYDSAWDGDTGNAIAEDTLTAYAVLWNAQRAQSLAQDAVDNFAAALTAAEEAFAYWKGLFDTGVAQIATATTNSGNADDAELDAYEDVDAAWVALGAEIAEGILTDTPATAPLTLNEAVYNAEIALDILANCDADCLQESIDDAQHEIDLIQPSLDALEIIVAGMEAQYDIYMDTFIDGDLDSDLAAEVIALQYELLQLKLEKDLIIAERDFVKQILDNIEDTDNLADIRWELEQAYEDTGWNTLTGAMEDLETAEDALATFMSEAQNAQLWLDYLQAEVDRYQQRYENALALAAEYLALMNAALDS